MATTFAYEYYKRNRFALVIGTKAADRKPQLMWRSEGGHKVYYRDEDQFIDDNPIITGYYDARPQTSFSTDFSPATNELNDIINMFYNAKDKFLGFLSAFKGADAAKSLQDGLDNLLHGKFKDAWKDVAAVGENVHNAGQAPHAASMSPTLMHWKGSAPITFNVKFIFIDKDGGSVKMDNKIKLLMSTVGSMGFNDNTFSTMRGPLGYNTNVFGDKAVYDILKRDPNSPNAELLRSLHSLILKQGEVTVLDLRNLLIINKVDVKASEQLYIPDREEPSYKWITADVQFSTVCPIPAPLANTYTSMLSFYGINEAYNK